MNIKKAFALIKGEKEKEKELEKAYKTIEEEKIKEERERQEQEKKDKLKHIKEMQKRFPTEPCKVYTHCWKCGKKIVLNYTEKMGNNRRILRIAECPKCKAFSVDKIDARQGAGLEYERYVRNF